MFAGKLRGPLAAALTNQAGAELSNTGTGTSLFNQAGATLTNTGAGTLLANTRNATLTNTGTGTKLMPAVPHSEMTVSAPP